MPSAGYVQRLCFLGLANVYLAAAIAALWAFRRLLDLRVGLLDLRGVAELGLSGSVAWDPQLLVPFSEQFGCYWRRLSSQSPGLAACM